MTPKVGCSLTSTCMLSPLQLSFNHLVILGVTLDLLFLYALPCMLPFVSIFSHPFSAFYPENFTNGIPEPGLEDQMDAQH